MKPDSPKLIYHVLQKAHPRKIHYRQSSSQRGDEGWNGCLVIRWFRPKIDPVIEEFEVLQVFKQPDEV
jgi:hypothetical protein